MAIMRCPNCNAGLPIKDNSILVVCNRCGEYITRGTTIKQVRQVHNNMKRDKRMLLSKKRKKQFYCEHKKSRLSIGYCLDICQHLEPCQDVHIFM